MVTGEHIMCTFVVSHTENQTIIVSVFVSLFSLCNCIIVSHLIVRRCYRIYKQWGCWLHDRSKMKLLWNLNTAYPSIEQLRDIIGILCYHINCNSIFSPSQLDAYVFKSIIAGRLYWAEKWKITYQSTSVYFPGTISWVTAGVGADWPPFFSALDFDCAVLDMMLCSCEQIYNLHSVTWWVADKWSGVNGFCSSSKQWRLLTLPFQKYAVVHK